MKTSHCLFSSTSVLRNIFICNATSTWETPGQLGRLLLPAVTAPIQPPSLPPRRPFTTHRVAQFRNSHPGPKTGNAATAPGPLRDHNIIFPWIQLRNDDNTLGELQRTSAVLKKLNLEKESLVLVAPPRKDSSSKGPQYPICRIVNRQAELAAKAEKVAAQKKTPKLVSKDLELNWAIAPHDLRTRMNQLKKFLSKGYQVRVTMSHPRKKSKRRAGLAEAKEVLKFLEETVVEIPGAKETRPREGTVGDMLVLLLQAPAGGAPSTAVNSEPTKTPAGTTTTAAAAAAAATSPAAADAPTQ